MVQSAPSHTMSPVLETAIETSSTALKINCEYSGKATPSLDGKN
jgi:hypothetical protein